MVLILVVLPATMLSIARYHDAVFVDTPLFSAGFAFLCGGFMWLATFKLFFPMSGLFGNASFPYWQNGTADIAILPSLGASLMSMYAQCALIGTVFLWTIWSSMIRRHTLDAYLGESNSEIQSFDRSRSRRRITSSGANTSQSAMRHVEDEPSSSRDRHALLHHVNCDTGRQLKSFTRRVLAVSLVVALLYSSARFTVAAYSGTILSSNAKFYSSTLLHTLFYLPVIIMCLHVQFLTRASRRFQQCCQSSCAGHVGRGLGVDDVVYLVSLFGTFLHRIFDIIPYIALTILNKSFRSIVGLMYKCFLVYAAWLISSFLHRVRRQYLSNINEVKWTLATLVYLGFVSAAQWLKDSWDERYEDGFFEPRVSKLIDFLLQPLVLMFRLMTSLIAYETYHIVVSKYKEISSNHTTNYGTIQRSR
ncbi:uncharacterized protein [Diadema antillarum]|uniref:uncharacterized protein n=1 Tax=Diadema antillarum TaxID=105358 RepID=UPI003A8A563D